MIHKQQYKQFQVFLTHGLGSQPDDEKFCFEENSKVHYGTESAIRLVAAGRHSAGWPARLKERINHPEQSEDANKIQEQHKHGFSVRHHRR
jgi:hypothetical protein